MNTTKRPLPKKSNPVQTTDSRLATLEQQVKELIQVIRLLDRGFSKHDQHLTAITALVGTEEVEQAVKTLQYKLAQAEYEENQRQVAEQFAAGFLKPQDVVTVNSIIVGKQLSPDELEIEGQFCPFNYHFMAPALRDESRQVLFGMKVGEIRSLASGGKILVTEIYGPDEARIKQAQLEAQSSQQP